jgi:hypothetical protein
MEANFGSDSEFTPSRFWQRLLTLLLRERKGNLPAEMIEGILAKEEIGNADFEMILGALHKGGQRLILLLDNFDQLIRTQVTNETVIRGFLSLFFFGGQTAQSDWTNPPKWCIIPFTVSPKEGKTWPAPDQL